MTWLELRNKIKDLGFEEESTMQEYSSIVENAVNRAINVIYYTVVLPNKDYYIHRVGEEPDEPQYITSKTKDKDGIYLPDNVIELLPLLSAYYVWLDDDSVKAAMYKNEYEDLKEVLFGVMNARPKLIFGKGLDF